MSLLFKKSADTIKASELLFKNQHYNSSIHCSYYSCLQVMKHVMLKQGFTEEEFENKQYTHEYMVGYFTSKQSNLIVKIRDFAKHIYRLKRMRKDADYNSKDHNFNECEDALKLAGDIWLGFKEYYKL